ncbi:MAG: class I SAM-dependent methyltransferase [Phaeodactylibacter sp.]|nr:class I SAM-dependent methyltransferase [Phaeodactylibacter sp.]
MNPYHESNRTRWDAAAAKWKAMIDRRGAWREAPSRPELAFAEQEMKYFSGIAGNKVAVLGSGDNMAVFAFAGMGARVTSVDISEKQLENARERAEALGLAVEFLQADVTGLSALPDAAFDLVYTGGHVAVWVSNLQQYYSEAVRILRPGGLFLVNEYHPFRRIWKKGLGKLEVEVSYYNRGPFRYDYSNDILEPEAGSYPCYEFHWTVSDLIQAMLCPGCRLIEAAEFGTHVGDWEAAPLEGLPEWLLLVGRKE